MEKNQKPYEMVNHPTHYNKYDVEVIEMMNRVWGPAATAVWAKLTAFKYRMRLGEKPDNPVEQDLAKEAWYLERAEFYQKLADKAEADFSLYQAAIQGRINSPIENSAEISYE